MSFVVFSVDIQEVYLVVATSKDLNIAPRNSTINYLNLYRFVENYSSIQLVHKV